MTAQTQLDGVTVRIGVDADPGVWLAGPHSGADPAPWARRALAAVCADFRVEPGSDVADYLATVLRHFAEAELGSPFRFLRLRGAGDAPVVARLDIVAIEDGEADPLTLWDTTVRWYDHGPQIVMVDEERGLRRATRLYVDDAVRASVRLHRVVPELGVHLVVSSSGSDYMTTASGVHDLDQLAQSVWLYDADRRRR